MSEEVSFAAEHQNKNMQMTPEFTISIMNVATAPRRKILLLFSLFIMYICHVQHV